MSDSVTRIDPSRTPIFVGDALTPADLDQLYPHLAAPLSEGSVQRTFGQQTKKGYDTTGYGYQWLVNRMNEVLGVTHWRVLSEEVHRDEIPYGQGKAWDVTEHVTVQIGNWVTESGEFQVIAQHSCWGGHVSKNLGDAKKGAYTNGFKKTVAFFGPGRQAYEGSLDDDHKDPEGNPGGYVRDGRPEGGSQSGAPNSSQPPFRPRSGQVPQQGGGNQRSPRGQQPPQGQPPAQGPGPSGQGQRQAGRGQQSARGALKNLVVEQPPAQYTAQSGEFAKQPYALVAVKTPGGKAIKVVAFAPLLQRALQMVPGEVISGQFEKLADDIYRLHQLDEVDPQATRQSA